MRQIVPIAEMTRRMPEQGRIRIGVRGARGAPKALDCFRFTSPDKDAIEALAALYGGTARPWNDPSHQGQWELVSDASEIRVVLPPEPLGDTPIYEFWLKGGIQGRCDGITALVPMSTADGAEMTEQPCICDAKQQMACKPKTRLNVVLPDIRFGGSWRLETGGWNAAQELPGMVETIVRLQDRGFVVAKLALRKRTSTHDNQTRHFVVPVLLMDETPEGLVAGNATLTGIASQPPVAALPQPEERPIDPAEAYTKVMDTFDLDPDDDVTDAEIVDERPFEDEGDRERLRRLMFALLAEGKIDADARAGFAMRASNGRTRSTSELRVDELTLICNVLAAIRDGHATYNGVNEAGYVLVGRA